MKYTKSGALSVGAPHSLARINEECRHSIENGYHLLLLTEEGIDILRKFSKVVGCDFDLMCQYEEEESMPGHVAEWIDKNSNEILIFMRGLMTRCDCIQ